MSKTTTTKWVPIVEIKISGDVGSGKSALYATIAQALEDAGVFVEHAKPDDWTMLQNSGEVAGAQDTLDEISPHVILSEIVER